MPRKCGANKMVGVLARTAVLSPARRMRRCSRASLPCHSQMRSNSDCARRTQCCRMMRWRWVASSSGKHSCKLMSAMRLRLRAKSRTRYMSQPSAAPNARHTPRGSRASSASTAYVARSMPLGGGNTRGDSSAGPGAGGVEVAAGCVTRGVPCCQDLPHLLYLPYLPRRPQQQAAQPRPWRAAGADCGSGRSSTCIVLARSESGLPSPG